MIQLPPDFREFLTLLNANAVDYIVVGGYAVNLHGFVRATGDIDVWLRTSEENAAKLRVALRQFGFSDEAIPPNFAAQPTRVLAIGVPPFRIEMLTAISGVAFEDALLRRIVVNMDGLPVPVISREDLRTNKKASGRLKDLADLEGLGL